MVHLLFMFCTPKRQCQIHVNTEMVSDSSDAGSVEDNGGGFWLISKVMKAEGQDNALIRLYAPLR